MRAFLAEFDATELLQLLDDLAARHPLKIAADIDSSTRVDESSLGSSRTRNNTADCQD